MILTSLARARVRHDHRARRVPISGAERNGFVLTRIQNVRDFRQDRAERDPHFLRRIGVHRLAPESLKEGQ